ncbi:aspartate 1-decarboxylase [Microcoleus sp. N9_A1]|uniref:aspartate 1-decarboxylase n=1 Tax=Microcoleus sp. N9_A1 TaxID=3055380 RepID=UPI002FD18602
MTDAKRDYVGSITIDQELLEKVGILPLEEVEIVNISNGNRWSTYALPGEAGTGCICPNGGLSPRNLIKFPHQKGDRPTT